ncbi:MAG: adenine phosphoribosyltransferase [Elusimicrobium sp.]|jgi:adenine phosphoribosyltransferase|nr:adenine phosphoribosyltransferase [Elusimicrobium sp.]
MASIKDYILDVPDFPKKGVAFKDITPLLLNHYAFKETINLLVKDFKNKGITKVAGIDSRGFLLAAPCALMLGAGLVPIRKKGKLPREVYTRSYQCEYHNNEIDVHKDAFFPSDKVLIVDDVLATGGTARAAYELVKLAGAEVAGLSFLLELGFLNGRNCLPEGPQINSLVNYKD